MGLDRLTAAALVLLAAGCGRSHLPQRLIDGQRAQQFSPVHGSVIAMSRVLRGTMLGTRFSLCRPAALAGDPLVVERIGVVGESLTFLDRRDRTVYSCDGGVDPAGEHRGPWCSGSAGRMIGGRLLDPRLDVACRDRAERPLAYVWVEPVAGARWIGVDQGSYTEIYESLAGLPVRVASTRNVQLDRSRAAFGITQYDVHGRELVRGVLEAAVAG